MKKIGAKVLLGIPAVLLVAAACAKSPAKATAGGANPASKTSAIAVSQKEWAIQPAVSSVTSGAVTFKVTNNGSMTHEFVVLRTDAAPGGISVQAGKAAEAGHQGEVEDIAPGTTKTLSLNLPPGHYVLLCNIPGHYLAGMHAAITVTT